MRKLNGTIMSANIPVVKVTDGVVESKHSSLAPLFFNRSDDVYAWLESRAIDSHRTNSRLLKKALRLTEKDDVSTVLAVNAVTITDNYWFKEDGSNLTWEDVKFKDNVFDNLALRGDPDSFNNTPSRTPELTNTGSYEKCWRLIDGKWWMYKSGNDNELFSELFIYELGSSLGFNMAYYEYADGYVRTLDFTDHASVNFETVASLVADDEDYNRNFDLLLSMSEEVARDYLMMIYLDTICMNMDRHTKNYGVLRDTTTGEVISLAPDYDNNIALISRGYPKNISRNNDMLIEFFVQLLLENKNAYRVFTQSNVPEITEPMIYACMDNIPFEVDREKIAEFILNGQTVVQDMLFGQTQAEDIDHGPTLTM